MTRRYSARREVHAATAAFSTDVFFGHGYLRDVSVPGCRLLTAASLQPGQTLNLEFRFTPEHPPLRVPLAVVRWVDSPFAGLEFIGMSPADQARLRQLVGTLIPSTYDLVSDPFLADEREEHHA